MIMVVVLFNAAVIYAFEVFAIEVHIGDLLRCFY